jgi:trimeric autotransporter adhesin
MRKLLASVLLTGVSLYLLACGGGNSNNGGSGGSGGGGGGGTPPPVTLSTIAVSPASTTIAPGTTAQFKAQAKYSDGSTKDLTAQVTWKSSATNIATVNTNGVAGLAKAMAAGSASISATLSGVSGSATLIVTNATLVSMAVTPANPSINVKTQQQFTASGSFSDGTTQDITNTVSWTSSPASIASITTGSGLATGKAVGTTTITATFTTALGSVSGSTQLSVTLANLVALSITPPNPFIAMNTFQAFAAIGTFSDGSTHNITTTADWSSSASNVATISLHNAVAKGLAAGTTTIAATVTTISGPLNASAVLTVTSATLVTVAVAPASLSIPAGVVVNLSATGTFSDGTTQDLTVPCNWASQNTGVATVNNSGANSGIMTAISPGSATITATSPASLGGIVGSTGLNVNTATLVSIAVTSPGSATTTPSGNVQFTATGNYSDSSTHAITKAVTWTSSNASVATVNGNGLATGQGSGTATISATQSGITGKHGILVTSSQLQSITIAPANAGNTVAQQTSVQLTAVGHFADGSTQNLTSVATWTSSSPAVATVTSSSGVVTGVSPGIVKLTAVFSGIGGSLSSLQVTNATLTGLTISPKLPVVPLGSGQQFTATGSFSDGSMEVLTIFSNWSSSNAGVAVVNGSGLATSSGTGQTNIIVKATQNALIQSDSTTLTVQ